MPYPQNQWVEALQTRQARGGVALTGSVCHPTREVLIKIVSDGSVPHSAAPANPLVTHQVGTRLTTPAQATRVSKDLPV